MSNLTVQISREEHTRGNVLAGCIFVEYGDYECPYCGRAYPVVKELQKRFGDEFLFAYRNFPLTQLHPHAEQAAETAEFAGTKERFWEMHDLLFENQEHLSVPLFEQLAERLALPRTELQEALTRKLYLSRVRADVMGGIRSGVNGTPTFFINGRRHNGRLEYDDLVRAIEESLAS